MVSPVDFIVDRYLDWRAFTGDGDLELEVDGDESSGYDVTYGREGHERLRSFEDSEKVVEFFSSRLKNRYQEDELFTLGTDEELVEETGRRQGGVGYGDDEWAFDVSDAMQQLNPWIERDAYISVGPPEPEVVFVEDTENLEEQSPQV
jgi:hypothetical protein